MRIASRLLAGLLLLMAACARSPAEQATATTSATTVATAEDPSTTVPPPTTAPPTTSTLPPGTESLPLSIREEIAELISVTEELRELRFIEPPDIVVLPPDEFEARVRAEVEEDTENVDADAALYELLGLLPPDTDLLALYADLYGEQVAGFYDLETGELVVPVTARGFTPLQRTTLVHELTHALTDQHYSISERNGELIDTQDYDAASALLGVIEGDAMLTEVLYLQKLSFADRQAMISESLSVGSEVFDRVPEFIRGSLLFPYQAGFAFVQRAYERGGFEEIGRIYRNPPLSTEQILTPRDYERDVPMEIEFDLAAPAGYESVYHSVWGELAFDLMFDQVLGGRDEAVDGWGGDRYRVWFDGTEVAVALAFLGDTVDDAAELESVLLEYAAAAMAVGDLELLQEGARLVGDDFFFVRRSVDRLVLVAASDPAVGLELAARAPLPMS